MLSRVIVAVVLAAVGFCFGTLGTITHSSTAGTIALPWGIVVALAAVACLLAGIRLLSSGPVWMSRVYTASAGAGVLVAIGLYAQESFGGSVLITDSTIGWTWMAGAAVIAVLAVMLPTRVRAGDAS